MSDQPPLPADDAGQRDELDAFLDALAHGGPVPLSNLDPTLAATVRHVHALASERFAGTRRAGKAQRWEDLMQNRIARSTVTPFPATATLSRLSAPAPIRLRPVVQTSRLRRLGGQSLGLVATLTLVLLVAASSLTLYLTAPEGGDEPTTFPAAAYGATPEATPALTPTQVGDASSDLARVTAVECTVEPTQLNEVMEVLSAPVDGRPFDQAYLDSFDSNPLDVRRLVAGPPVTTAVQENLTTRYGEYLGCYLPLQQARFFSDAGLLRYYRTEPSPILTAQRYEFLWLDQQGTVTPPASGLGFLNLGVPGRSYLYGFRMLNSDRVGAYLALNQGRDLDATPETEEAGFVVFVQIDGQWFIDEVRPVPAG